jgi:hypothetical protein
MPQFLGLQAYIPTPLLLVEAAQKQVHLPMQYLIWILLSL